MDKKTNNELEPLLTIREAAQFIGKKPNSIRCDVTRNPGRLPQFIRRNSHIYFLPSSIKSWQMEGGHVEPKQEAIPSLLALPASGNSEALQIKRKSSRPRKSTVLNLVNV